MNQYIPDHRLDRLLAMITELQEEASLAELKKLLDEGVNPRELLTCCMEGMRRIGELFENGTYFIAALIMAGEIMRSATELLTPRIAPGPNGGGGGKVLLGTIQGDIHDLGKNLFALLLRSHGFEITDIGVDVNPETFFSKTQEIKPDIIGISCVLTSSVENLKQAIHLLQEETDQPKPEIIVGGTCMDQRLAAYIGARLWAKDAAEGLKFCRNAMDNRK